MAHASADAHQIRPLARELGVGRSLQNTEALNNRIFSLDRALSSLRKDPAGVDRSFLTQITKQPRNPWVRSQYASFLMSHGYYDRAERYFQEALSIMEYPETREGLQRTRSLLRRTA